MVEKNGWPRRGLWVQKRYDNEEIRVGQKRYNDRELRDLEKISEIETLRHFRAIEPERVETHQSRRGMGGDRIWSRQWRHLDRNKKMWYGLAGSQGGNTIQERSRI